MNELLFLHETLLLVHLPFIQSHLFRASMKENHLLSVANLIPQVGPMVQPQAPGIGTPP